MTLIHKCFLITFCLFLGACSSPAPKDRNRTPASVDFQTLDTKTTEDTLTLSDPDSDSYDLVMAQFRKYSPALQSCFWNRMKVKKIMAVKTTLVFEVNEEGNVRNPRFKKDVIKDKILTNCLIDEVLAMQFSAPGERVKILYKLEFDPRQRRSN